MVSEKSTFSLAVTTSPALPTGSGAAHFYTRFSLPGTGSVALMGVTVKGGCCDQRSLH